MVFTFLNLLSFFLHFFYLCFFCFFAIFIFPLDSLLRRFIIFFISYHLTSNISNDEFLVFTLDLLLFVLTFSKRHRLRDHSTLNRSFERFVLLVQNFHRFNHFFSYFVLAENHWLLAFFCDLCITH